MVESFGDSAPHEVSRRELANVIEARIDEIFETVQKEMKRSGYDGLLRAGAVLTGGAAQLPGMQETAAKILNCPVRIGRPDRLTGMADALKSPSYATSVGLLRVGLNLDTALTSDHEKNGNGTSINNVWSAMTKMFRRLLPDERSN